jgi:hypothetical protein
MWRYSYEIAGGILIVLSSVVSEQMPTEWRLRMWIGFILLAVVYSGVGIHLAKQDQIEQVKRDTDLQELRRKFDQSVVEQAHMSGHLEGIQTVMDNLSKSGWPGMKEFAAAISRMNSNYQQQQNATQLSNGELCSKTRDLANRIRDFQSTSEVAKRVDEDQQRLQEITMIRQGKSREELAPLWKQNEQHNMAQDAAHENEFRSRFMGEGKYYKDLLFDKLPPDRRSFFIENNSEANMDFALQHFTGGLNEYGLAGYLDELANVVCPLPQSQGTTK